MTAVRPDLRGSRASENYAMHVTGRVLQNSHMTGKVLAARAVLGVALSRWHRVVVALSALMAVAGLCGAASAGPDDRPLVALGPGDSVNIKVYGQPDMDGTVLVADDGTLSVALVGPVPVGGLSPSDAAKRVEQALVDGHYLNSPHVTLTVTQSRSQRVSVLGEVHAPGRYAVESNTTILDLLAVAGGTTDAAGDLVYVLHPEADGSVSRRVINLHQVMQPSDVPTDRVIQSGESVFVPRAEQFYVYGAVNTPGAYRLEPGMTVRQAIARAGGVSTRGSDRRVEIQRRGKNGEDVVQQAKPTDIVQANDVVKVKESLF